MCGHCKNLTNIPDTLINLTQLYCYGCINLTDIPNTFINLIKLDCRCCRNLISIPNNINIIKSNGCRWLNHNNKNYIFNIQKLKVLQLWVRKNLRYWIFKRWIKSEDGVKWLYDPNNIGGKASKLAIMRSIVT